MVKFNEYIMPKELPKEIITKRGHDTIRYLNTANGFDIETSSFRDADDNKRATMYIWMMGIDGQIVYGRTWGEFQWFLAFLKDKYQLGIHKRMIVYVHNLGYEFQFLINHVGISQTFSRTMRHPIKTLIEDGFELRCSFMLSGLSLEKTAEELKVRKQTGLLDYTKLRHSGTPLTEDELKYCEYDIKVIHEFITKEIQKCGDITKIPLTKTGYVREYCRNYISEHYNYKTYRDQILKEFPDKETFILLNKAFAGGFTHANYLRLFEIWDDVWSIDFTSSYPAQMIMHKYPRGKFALVQNIQNSRFEYLIKRYACVFEIKLYNVEALTTHHIWSSAKCDYGTNSKYNAVIDNGRIVSSDCIYTRMTDVDFKLFCLYYKFDAHYEVYNFHYTHYGYLPKGLIECILKFYADKTTLKGQPGKEEFYLIAKGMLNAIYGMMVTNPVNDEILFTEGLEWDKTEPPMDDALNKVKNSPRTFLCYQWGVWVTAWARYELLKTVHKINEDVIYCDTDSIKFFDYDKYLPIIARHNVRITSALKKAVSYFGLDTSLLSPEDIKGEKHPLGVWECEGKYDKFKTLGAKRYCYMKNNRFHVTASGINPKFVYLEDVKHLDLKKLPKEFIPEFSEIPKEKWIQHWHDVYDKSPVHYMIMQDKKRGGFDSFEDGLEIPAEYSKRLLHTYSKPEDSFRMVIRDYCNSAKMVEEFCYIHLEKIPYKMSIGEEFVEYLEDFGGDPEMLSRCVRDELAINILQKQLKEHKDKGYAKSDIVHKKKEKHNGRLK